MCTLCRDFVLFLSSALLFYIIEFFDFATSQSTSLVPFGIRFALISWARTEIINRSQKVEEDFPCVCNQLQRRQQQQNELSLWPQWLSSTACLQLRETGTPQPASHQRDTGKEGYVCKASFLSLSLFISDLNLVDTWTRLLRSHF